MAFFLILSLICLSFAAYSILRLVKDRFPNPVDLASISLIYYALPLSVAGYFYLNYGGQVLLNRYAGDQGLALQSMVYLTIALIGLAAGRWAGILMGMPQRLAFVPLSNATENRTELAFVSLLGLVLLGVVLFGIPEFALGYAGESSRATAEVGNALVYWAVESLGLVIMLMLLLRRQRPNPRLVLLVLASLVVLAIIFIVRAKRLEIVAALLPPALVLLSRRASIELSVKKVLVAITAVVALVLIASVRVDSGLDIFYTIFYVFSEGLYAGHTLPGVIDRTSGGLLAYEYGARFLNGVLAFIPSFLWDGKDDMIYAGNLQLQALAPLGATNLLAEVVLQGGAPAVAAIFFVMGAILQRLTLFQSSWDDAARDGFVPFRFGLYVIAIAVFIPHFRDGIIPSVKLSLQALVFFMLLVGGRMVLKSFKVTHHMPRFSPTSVMTTDPRSTSAYASRTGPPDGSARS